MFHPHGPSFWELARQALSSTKRGYDLLAPKFDFTPFRTPDVAIDPIAPHLAGASSGLDVCCGTGAGLEILAAEPGLERIVGIDFSEGMLARARENLDSSDQRIEYVLGDVLQMEFENEFDVAITLGALGHFIGSDMEKLYRRIYDALKPGGRFIFPSAPEPGWTSPARWFCAGFNVAMRVRNALIHPPFIMFYHRLMFDCAELETLLTSIGFEVNRETITSQGHYDGLDQRSFCLIIAQKPMTEDF